MNNVSNNKHNENEIVMEKGKLIKFLTVMLLSCNCQGKHNVKFFLFYSIVSTIVLSDAHVRMEAKLRNVLILL